MPIDYQAHNRRMVERFLWLESIDPEYAAAALDAYRRHPHTPNPNILKDVKAEKQRRSMSLPPSESK